MEEVLRLDTIAVYRVRLGFVQTNTYLVVEPASGQCVVVDPADRGAWIVEQAQAKGWEVRAIWLTHAHFDHFAGAAGVCSAAPAPVSVALHRADLPLYNAHGGAALFGVPTFDLPGKPDLELQDGSELFVGAQGFHVYSTPGHSPGHVVFIHQSQKFALCGDLIFQGGVGRTDLPGGDWPELVHSIRSRIYSLPDDTILFPGHGPATTTAAERDENPFVQGVI